MLTWLLFGFLVASVVWFVVKAMRGSRDERLPLLLAAGCIVAVLVVIFATEDPVEFPLMVAVSIPFAIAARFLRTRRAPGR
jgi:hypothetical protein